MQTIDVIHAVNQPLQSVGASFYFDPATLAVGKELGLDGFRWYVLGRGGVLGDVEAAVVHAAFGYFHPAIVDRIWTSAAETMAPRDAARRYLGCAHDLGRARFDDVDGLDGFVEAARRVVEAADDAGLALFAGLRAEPWPDDTPAAAMHAAILLRELRGSVHLVAVVAEGLRSEIAHAIKRPDDTGVFGWDPAPAVTDADRAALEAAEERTNRILSPWFEVLDDDGRRALVAGATAMAEAG